MPKIVIDSNIVVKWLSKKDEEGVLKARKVYKLLASGEAEIFAPTFLLIEVLNILKKRKKISNYVIGKSIKKLIESEIRFKEIDKNEIEDLEKIVFEYDTTSYDAIFILLARKLNCRLLTVDERLLTIRDLTISLDDFLAEFKESPLN